MRLSKTFIPFYKITYIWMGNGRGGWVKAVWTKVNIPPFIQKIPEFPLLVAAAAMLNQPPPLPESQALLRNRSPAFLLQLNVQLATPRRGQLPIGSDKCQLISRQSCTCRFLCVCVCVASWAIWREVNEAAQRAAEDASRVLHIFVIASFPNGRDKRQLGI